MGAILPFGGVQSCGERGITFWKELEALFGAVYPPRDQALVTSHQSSEKMTLLLRADDKGTVQLDTGRRQLAVEAAESCSG